MRIALVIIGVLLVLGGGWLPFTAETEHGVEQWRVLLGIVGIFAGVACIVLAMFLRLRAGAIRDGFLAEVGINARTYRAAAAGARSYPATVRSARNTNEQLGNGVRVGTVLELTVARDHAAVTGTVKEFLTPARIAELTPGTQVQVKPVPAIPGQYILERS